MSWTEKKLGDFAPFVYGKGLPKEKRIEGDVPVYGSNGIVGSHNEALLSEPVVVIGRKGSVGEVHLTNGPSWPIDTSFYAQGGTDVDLDFLYYLLQTLPLKNNSDSAVPGLNREYAHSLEVRVPERDLQNSISSVLKCLDNKISANTALSKTLEDIAQTLFKSWFVDFDPVRAKLSGEKPVGMDDVTATLFPDSLEDSELGAIPKGWTVKPLFDFQLEIESGSRPKGGIKGIDEGVPSIGAESINGIGVFDFSKTKYVSEEFFEKMNKGKPRDFDVLLYKDGGKPGEFKPRVGMFGKGFPFERYAINEHVFLLRSVELGPAFTYFWIRMERTLDILRNRGIKAAIPGINQQDVGTLPVLCPNSELIAKFTELSMPYLELILTLASESLELSRLRDALLPRLISGELQIPEEMLVP
jgi:type I restriction enzyme S subunit